MRWHEGDIVDAIAASKAKNAIFVVYVEGDDELSKRLTALIDDEAISGALQTDQFTAVRLRAGSLSHKQFEAIYSTVKVPSLFFIGKNGHTFDVVERVDDADQLAERVEKVVAAHTGKPFQLRRTTETFLANEQKSSDAAPKKDDIVCENGVCYRKQDQPTTSKSVDVETEPASPSAEPSAELAESQAELAEPTSEPEPKEMSKEEKVLRAKELIDKKREMKKAEEEESARTKELERRRMGKDVQKMHRWQQDQELKNIMEERQRAKNEEKAARDRILAQIAQDKAERALKFSSPPPQPAAGSGAATTPPRQNVAPSNTARLQFRLPDGSTDTNDFESSATLQEVHNYIGANIRLPFRSYTLSTTFPRREFGAEHSAQTLLELGLCPNAVVLIIAGRAGAVTAAADTGLGAMLWTLLAPLLHVLGYLRSLLFGRPAPADAPADPAKRAANDSPDAEPHQPQPKRKPTETTVVHRQGNIHRFRDRDDSDDENNTWNGNSTQQM